MEAHFTTPLHFLVHHAGRGGSVRGVYLLCQKRGSQQQHIWLKMIPRIMFFLPHLCGGIFFVEKNFWAKICVQRPFLQTTKGPARKPISPTPPLTPFGGRPCPPLLLEQFSGRPLARPMGLSPAGGFSLGPGALSL